MSFSQNTSQLMADALEFLSVCGKFYVLYVSFGYIFKESLRKCKNKDHTFLFQCINISRVSRKQFEDCDLAASDSNNSLETRQMFMHEKTCSAWLLDDSITLGLLGNCACFLSPADISFVQNQNLGIPSKCQTVWIQIRSSVL